MYQKLGVLFFTTLLIVIGLALLPAKPAEANHQASHYLVTAITGTYTALTMGTTFPISGTADDGWANNLPIGFNFTYAGVEYDTFAVSTNGFITLGSGSTNLNDSVLDNAANGGLATNTMNGIRPIIAPLWDDLSTAGGSMQYLTSGTAPNRVLTVEWNALWNYAAGGVVLSFQVKLYEADGRIEFIYLEDITPVNAPSATIGIAGPAAGDYMSVDTEAMPIFADPNNVKDTIATVPTAPAFDQRVIRFMPYVFTTASGSFTPLTGATAIPVGSGDGDDGYTNSQPIGFTFNYLGTAYDSFGVSTNGFMTLGSGTTSISDSVVANDGGLSTSAMGGNNRPIIAPFWDDLDTEESGGTMSYLLSGSAPNRILTVQWLNMEWDSDADAAVISFQVKLYEANGQIDYIYRQDAGTSTTTSGEIFGASIGLSSPIYNSFFSLSDASATPTANTTGETYITTRPATGQLYRFTPWGAPIITPSGIKVYLPYIFKHTASWKTQTSPTASTLNGIDCPGNFTCFAVSEAHQVVQTSNGSTWSAVNLSTGFPINGVDCLDTTNCIGAGDSGVTINTSNGSTWSVNDLPSNTDLYGASYPNAGVQYWAGDHGRITRFAGAIVNVTMCDGCSFLKDIDCSLTNGGTCTSVGLNGEIYYTNDGWTTWNKATPTGNHLYGISCPSDTTCFAVGANGTILKGSYNSAGWTSQTSGTTSNLKSISCPGTNTCFAAGTGGTIITTNDGGATWLTETSGTTQDLNGISCPTSGNCYAVGTGGTIIVRQ